MGKLNACYTLLNKLYYSCMVRGMNFNRGTVYKEVSKETPKILPQNAVVL